MKLNYCIFKEILSEPLLNGVFRPVRERGKGIKLLNMGELFAYSRVKDPPMDRVELSEKERSRFLLKEGDLLFARSSLVAEGAGKCSMVLKLSEPTCFESHVIRARIDKNKANPLFYFYYFNSINGFRNIHTLVEQVAAAGIRQSDLQNIKIPYPEIQTQTFISSILCNFDDYIENLIETNRKVFQIMKLMFKEWFINFNIPINEFRENQTLDVNKELVEKLPKDWKLLKLGEFIEIFDSKRVPLSNKERESRKGIYPYYGAADIMDYIDDYIFNDIYLLVGEDGTVIDEKHHPILQYVWGKFWVNNHTHVIQGKNGVSTEYLFLFLSHVNVKPFVTGAVQPKINQANLKAIDIIIPPSTILMDFNRIINNAFELYRNLSNRIKILFEIKNITSRMLFQQILNES